MHLRRNRGASPAAGAGDAGAGGCLYPCPVAVSRAMSNPLIQLAIVFGQMSLLAFGGANAVIPEMQRQVVDVHHWMTGHEFAALSALAQAAPGPNMMVVSLVGWQVGGVWGALVTTLSVAVPSSTLTLVVSGVVVPVNDVQWRKAL